MAQQVCLRQIDDGQGLSGRHHSGRTVCKRGSQATKGVLTSGLFCDIVRALHKTAAIECVDLADCDNAVAHPIASIALQSFKVRKVMVAMMLYMLETMTWYQKRHLVRVRRCLGEQAGTRQWD